MIDHISANHGDFDFPQTPVQPKRQKRRIEYSILLQAHHVSTIKRASCYLNLKLVFVAEMVETPDDDDEFM